jgi:predicted dehydrogenase
MSNKIRVAVFGIVHPHVNMLSKAILAYPDDFEMIGFAEYPIPTKDPVQYEKRRGMLSELGMKEYAYEELLAEKPDFALVLSDNGSREELCCMLLERGIHVMDEKPMAPTFDGAQRIMRTAKEHGVMMLSNWPIAWLKPFRKAKELVDSGRIGKLMRVTYRSPATWGPFSFPLEEHLKKSWWYTPECGGGALLDYACYGAVLATFMFGTPAMRVSGIKKNFGVTDVGVEDYSAMILDFGDGVGLLEGSWSTYNPGEIPTGPILYGTDGVIVCDRYSNQVKVYEGRTHKPQPPVEVIDCGEEAQANYLGAHLASVFKGECEPDIMLSPEINIAVVAALDAGRESADTGVTVECKKYID